MNELEKWDRGRTLLLESLYKPDSKLRGCAYNQDCFDEIDATPILMNLKMFFISAIKSTHSG